MTPPSRRSAATALALAAILLGALGLRLHQIGGPSIWWDEIFAITASAGHVGDWYAMPRNTVIDTPPDLTSIHDAAPWRQTWHTPDIHPPLYATILREWRTLFGDSDVAARALSVFASLVAIVLLFDAGRTLFGVGPALWACALMAVAEYQVAYGQNATGYALLTTWGVGALAAAARLDKHGFSWPATTALTVCLIAMPLTHYYAVGPMAALGLWGLFHLPRRVCVLTCVGLGVSAGLILILAHSAIQSEIVWIKTNANWMSDDSPGRLARLAHRILQTPMQFLADPQITAQGFAAVSALAFILPFLLMRRQPTMLVCGLWLVGSVGIGATADLLTHSSSLEHIRFSLLGAPAFYLILAGLPIKNIWLRHVIPAAAVITCLQAYSLAYDFPNMNGDWRSVGHDVAAARIESDDILVITTRESDFLCNPMQVFGYVSHYSGRIACPVVLLNAPASPELLARLKSRAHIWVIALVNSQTDQLVLPVQN